MINCLVCQPQQNRSLNQPCWGFKMWFHAVWAPQGQSGWGISLGLQTCREGNPSCEWLPSCSGQGVKSAWMWQWLHHSLVCYWLQNLVCTLTTSFRVTFEGFRSFPSRLSRALGFLRAYKWDLSHMFTNFLRGSCHFRWANRGNDLPQVTGEAWPEQDLDPDHLLTDQFPNQRFTHLTEN